MEKNPFVNVLESAYGNLAQPRTHSYSLDDVSGENIKHYLGGYATLTTAGYFEQKIQGMNVKYEIGVKLPFKNLWK